jgi:phosphoribosylamine---glycine ligase
MPRFFAFSPFLNPSFISGNINYLWDLLFDFALMNILIIGNGGREHAFAWKIRQSPVCDKLFVAPGNAGTSLIAENVAIAAEDFAALGDFCVDNNVKLVVVGPEAPLVKGIRDYFQGNPLLNSILFVGPDKVGAQLEGSKDFSKQFMLRHGIPTAKARTFDAGTITDALQYLDTCKPPVVLKADGLAAGKGVIICLTKAEAKKELEEILISQKFGNAGNRVLVEEFLSGIEVSVFVLTDGRNYVILPEAKDYKRIGEGDAGPNTGGMGAVSPVIFADDEFMRRVEEEVVKPTINGLRQEGIHYCGFIFAGLMNVGGKPYVIEYNARMGDPETQAVLPRIKNDLVDMLIASAQGTLNETTIEIDDAYAVTVALVSGGYPGNYEKGKKISSLSDNDNALVFHAGTRQQNDTVVTDGGRVLAVTGKGSTLEEARAAAYEIAATISWDGLYYRRDIGNDLINYKG